MRWVGVLVCVVAGYRLVGTPLQAVAGATAVVSATCAVTTLLAPPAFGGRIVTALQHVAAALGGFFLFVSIAMQ